MVIKMFNLFDHVNNSEIEGSTEGSDENTAGVRPLYLLVAFGSVLFLSTLISS